MKRREAARFPRWFRVLIGGVLVLVGCSRSGDELPRQPVSGTVTLDGKPLERGTISFNPASSLPTAAVAQVSGGSYSIARDQGLVPGSYKVTISSSPQGTVAIDAATGTPPPPGQPTPPPKELLPARYNAATTLVAEVKEGKNTFDFPLESRPKK